MSEATSPREWRFYVNDMIGFCERILAFTQGTGRAEFPADAMRYDATVRNIELVGEAATHVPESIRQNLPEIPWRMSRRLGRVGGARSFWEGLREVVKKSCKFSGSHQCPSSVPCLRLMPHRQQIGGAAVKAVQNDVAAVAKVDDPLAVFDGHFFRRS